MKNLYTKVKLGEVLDVKRDTYGAFDVPYEQLIDDKLKAALLQHFGHVGAGDTIRITLELEQV
jgi:hypothetical protein